MFALGKLAFRSDLGSRSRRRERFPIHEHGGFQAYKGSEQNVRLQNGLAVVRNAAKRPKKTCSRISRGQGLLRVPLFSVFGTSDRGYELSSLCALLLQSS